MLTKNTDTGAPEGSWGPALGGFDEQLRARGLAEKTRRAYGVDLQQLAEWATAHDLEPKDLGPRDLRRLAGVLSERGAGKSTIARKLAAIRTFYGCLVERGELDANPADLVSSPKRDEYLPKVLKPGEVAGLLEQIPGATPLELRDRAMFELAYSTGLRAEELVNLELTGVNADAEELRVEGRAGGPGAPPVEEWQAPLHIGRTTPLAAPCPAGRDAGRSDSAHP